MKLNWKFFPRLNHLFKGHRGCCCQSTYYIVNSRREPGPWCKIAFIWKWIVVPLRRIRKRLERKISNKYSNYWHYAIRSGRKLKNCPMPRRQYHPRSGDQSFKLIRIMRLKILKLKSKNSSMDQGAFINHKMNTLIQRWRNWFCLENPLENLSYIQPKKTVYFLEEGFINYDTKINGQVHKQENVN